MKFGYAQERHNPLSEVKHEGFFIPNTHIRLSTDNFKIFVNMSEKLYLEKFLDFISS